MSDLYRRHVIVHTTSGDALDVHLLDIALGKSVVHEVESALLDVNRRFLVRGRQRYCEPLDRYERPWVAAIINPANVVWIESAQE